LYKFAVKAAQGKKVIISETGWPTKGERYGGAVPSYENSLSYFLQTQKWVSDENIDMFYFSSFDEIWKMIRNEPGIWRTAIQRGKGLRRVRAMDARQARAQRLDGDSIA